MSAFVYGLTSPLKQLQQASHELERLDYLTIWHITDAVLATPEAKFAAWRAKHGVKNLGAEGQSEEEARSAGRGHNPQRGRDAHR